MSRVTVVALIAHDAYRPGDAYLVEPGRAQGLASAGLIHPAAITVETVKGARRGTRKAGQGGAEQDDPGSVPAGAGDSGPAGDEPS